MTSILIAPLHRIRDDVRIGIWYGMEWRVKRSECRIEYGAHVNILFFLFVLGCRHVQLFFFLFYFSSLSVSNRWSHCAYASPEHMYFRSLIETGVFQTWSSVPIHLHSSLSIAFQMNASKWNCVTEMN